MFNPVVAGLNIMFNGSETCDHEFEYEDYEYSDDNEDGVVYTTRIGTCKKCGDAQEVTKGTNE